MRRKRIMRNNLLWSLIIVGVLLTLSGIILGVVGAEVLNIPFVRMDLVPMAVGYCGVLLFAIGVSAITHEKHKTKKQHIEENDERNRSEEHTSELQSRFDLVCRLLLEK